MGESDSVAKKDSPSKILPVGKNCPSKTLPVGKICPSKTLPEGMKLPVVNEVPCIKQTRSPPLYHN